VNLRNDGVLPFCRTDHVIEVPARFTGGAFVAEPVMPLPDDLRGWWLRSPGTSGWRWTRPFMGPDRVLRAMRAIPSCSNTTVPRS